MDILSKNSTALLSINIVEVTDREYQRTDEVELFLSKTVTETITVNSYVRHRNSGCYLYIIALNLPPKMFKHCSI